jgi:aryl-alcohol dehydrogenase-like predicted oxidoreductase
MTHKHNHARTGVTKYLPRKGGKPTLPWLWLGTWSLGGEGFGPSDLRISLQVIEKAFEAGIRHIDTANVYAHGKSEKLVARVLGGANDLRESLMKNLDCLKTDYIDLFQLHWPDPLVPVSESFEALKAFQREGLIRYYGAGNLNASEIKKYVEAGLFLPHQVHFNPIHQTHDILKAGRELNRCFNCIVSPLEQGLLAGGRSSAGLEALGKRDMRRRNPHFHSRQVRKWLEKFQNLSSVSIMPRVSIALLWILAHDSVDIIIPGPRTIGQLKEILDHQEWMLNLNLTFQARSRNSGWEKKLITVTGHELWALLERGPS